MNSKFIHLISVLALLAFATLNSQFSTARAKSYQPIYSFTAGPLTPYAGLVQGPDGSFYGTSASGGSNDVGTVFKITTNGTVTTLYSFSAGGGVPVFSTGRFTNADGATPWGNLTLGPDGNFYGTTTAGGVYGYGTAFQVTTNGTLTTLVTFNGYSAESPKSALVFGPDGNLYGTSPYGGGYGRGGVFMLYQSDFYGTNYWNLDIIYSFTGGNDGSTPTAGLTVGPDGYLYGTTAVGGTNGFGTIFKIGTGYNGTFKSLASLDSTNGESPNTLTLGPDGNFYGSSSGASPFGQGGFAPGAVFRVATNGTLTTLGTFAQVNTGNGNYGFGPEGALALGPNGNFYGVANGRIFELSTNGTLYILNGGFAGNGASGSVGGLVLGSDGNFYGTTGASGANNAGSVFQMTTNGTLTTLVTFAWNNGVNPTTALTLGPDGNLYGTTASGGTNDSGTLFKITTNGAFALLVTFNFTNGTGPNALTLGPDGNFYGTTAGGGSNYDGTVFKVTTNGVLTTIYSFSAQVGANINGTYISTNSDGGGPEAALTLGPDGNFYGTTYGGGTNGAGTLFKVTTNGALSIIHYFAFGGYNNSFTNSDGAFPTTSLTYGPDGNLYGTTSSGGTNSYGTLFKITTNGTFVTLVTFTNWISANALMLWPYGNFYGTAALGGSNNGGTLFKVLTNGVLSTIYSFTAQVVEHINGTYYTSTNSDGDSPEAALTLGADGNFYGTTTADGINGGGTVFQVTANGTLTTLYSFTVIPYWLIGGNFSGWNPRGGVTLGPDGNFYGTTYGGGSGGGGVIYRLSPFSAVTAVNGGSQNYGAQLILGTNSGNGQLQVVNAGQFQSAGAILGGSGVGNNSAVVSGAGSVWTSTSDVIVGQTGSGNQLSVNSGGTMVVNGNLTVGSASSTGNLVQINNGTLIVTNSSGTGTLNINNGSLLFNGGTLIVNELIITNASGSFTFSGGVLQVTTAVVNNGVAFTIGDGTDRATYTLEGGTNFIESGFTVADNATVNGNGTVVSPAGIAFYGTASPGNSPGQLVLNGNVSLQGIANMEIDKTAHTNDLITGVGQLTFGGILQVSLLNGTALTNGDSFMMFSASNYVGTFASITPATPGPGLIWNTQTLYTNGVLSVVASPSLTAQFTVNPTNAPVGASVQFTGPVVDSGGNSITRWNWNLGDGGTSTAQNPTNVYTTAGTFTPTLTVTNSVGVAITALGPAITITGNEVVTNIADSGPGTLRTAITNATNGAVITFAPNLSGQTILLASSLNITTNLTIDASALPGGILINGNNQAVQVFNVATNNTVVMNSLTITKGGSAYGAGIANFGTVTMTQCILTGNVAINFNPDGYGGGIYNAGTMMLNQCTLTGNGASGPDGGSGGGIYNIGTLTLNESTLSGNSAFWRYGGGIFNSGILSVNQSTLAANSADGAGGGICNVGTLRLNQSTVSGNESGYSGDSGSGNGGGIQSGGTLTITNSIIAGNSASVSAGEDVYISSGLATFGGVNIVLAGNGNFTGSYPITAVPNLVPLGNYGGRTKTMPPLPGSPAIGSGSTNGNPFTTDQRGYPRTQNSLIDIGAVELPTVQFTASLTNGPVGLPVQFNATNVDSDGSSITQWNWNFGDGGTGTEQNPSHVYVDDGIYIPALVATNSLGLVLSNSGPAITITGNELVTTTNDSGYGSLRQAIANALAGVTITFAPNLSGQTIPLASTLTINTNLTIDASALTNGIQISGNHGCRIFNVLAGNAAVLTALKLVNGNGSGTDGGAIYNQGRLILNKCMVSGNSVSNNVGIFGGGGICNLGTLTLNNSTFSSNSVWATSSSQFGVNLGSGVGGGGAIYNDGTMIVNQCTLSGNSLNDSDGGGTVLLSGGGILCDQGSVAVNQSTLSGNSANDSGAAGAGVFVVGGIENFGSLTLSNAIVAGNSASFTGNPNLDGSFTGVNNLTTGVPLLAPLGYYGGLTQTMPPLIGSPAIGAGSVAGNTFTTDQRGYPRTQNGLIDIGAVELSTLQFSANPTNTTVGSSVQFNATNVDIYDSTITQWNWNFGDGTTSTAQNPAHVYATAGTFAPTLIVTNSLGLALAASGPVINSYLLTVQYSVTERIKTGQG